MDGGFTFTDYEIADVKETGISLDNSQNYEKIIIKGLVNVLKHLDVITKLKLEDIEDYYFDFTKSTGFPSCVTRIPNGVTRIDDTAFWGCTSLVSITIPNGVTSIGAQTFNGCTNLTSITIPDSITDIKRYVFGDCTSLISITIPNSVTAIGEYAFENCTSLKTINYKGTEEQWNAISKYNTWNRGCPSDMVINYNYQVQVEIIGIEGLCEIFLLRLFYSIVRVFKTSAKKQHLLRT